MPRKNPSPENPFLRLGVDRKPISIKKKLIIMGEKKEKGDGRPGGKKEKK